MHKLTNAELERLALVAEECGEVIQVIGKILRHGYTSFNPYDSRQTLNRELLEKEIGDLAAVMDLLVRNDLKPSAVAEHRKRKPQAMAPYLHYQKEAHPNG